MIDRYDVRQLLDSDDAAVRRMEEQEGDDSGETVHDAEQQEAEGGTTGDRDVAEERRMKLREALLAEEDSSGDWTLQQLERERYRALRRQRGGRDEDGSSSGSGADSDSDDDGRRKRRKGNGGGRWWHLAYDAQTVAETEADSRSEHKAEEKEEEEEEGSSDSSSPSSPPPPPFSPPFTVSLDIEMVQQAIVTCLREAARHFCCPADDSAAIAAAPPCLSAVLC